jgi:hypothetical protein
MFKKIIMTWCIGLTAIGIYANILFQPKQSYYYKQAVEEKRNDFILAQNSGVSSCETRDCGINIKTSCSVSCPPPKNARCSCDCIKRVFGVCAEVKENCRCE